MLPDSEVALRLNEADFGEVMAALEERLESLDPGDAAGWHLTDEGLLYLQSLSSGLLPLAGLEIAQALAHATTFIENFPIYGLPLGDVDERAGRWLAQLLDTGSIRQDYRAAFAALAGVWVAEHPQAADRARAWAELPRPEDPREDVPWLRAMVAIARTQVGRLSS